MNATARVGMLLLLAACGGRGDGGGAVDTTAMPAGTAIAPAASAPGDTAPAQTGSAAPAPKPAAPKRATEPAATKPATEPAATKPAAEPAAPKPAAAGGAAAPGAQQIALGDSIFHGQVAGGTCTACHSQDAKGTAAAPNLTDKEWINGDGSLAFIEKTVTNGVAQPEQHPAPMPPKGGAALDDQQVKAVAAYVFSLSH